MFMARNSNMKNKMPRIFRGIFKKMLIYYMFVPCKG